MFVKPPSFLHFCVNFLSEYRDLLAFCFSHKSSPFLLISMFFMRKNKENVVLYSSFPAWDPPSLSTYMTASQLPGLSPGTHFCSFSPIYSYVFHAIFFSKKKKPMLFTRAVSQWKEALPSEYGHRFSRQISAKYGSTMDWKQKLSSFSSADLSEARQQGKLMKTFADIRTSPTSILIFPYFFTVLNFSGMLLFSHPAYQFELACFSSGKT